MVIVGNICETAKAFERECENGLLSGFASAQKTKLLYQSKKTSDLDETYFSQRLLFMFADLRLNAISVIFPTEGYTGADIEIHVLLKYGGWCGLRLQAKRAVFEYGKLYFRELAHPKETGKQNGKLFQSSLDSDMVPLYLYYIPSNLVDELKGEFSISGAMVGSAWNANQFIEAGVTSAKSVIYGNTITLSSILCPLDTNDRHFVQRLENLFLDHIEDIEQEAALDADLDEAYPEFYETEAPVLHKTNPFRIAKSVPEDVARYFMDGVQPRVQEGQEHCGAILINRLLFSD